MQPYYLDRPLVMAHRGARDAAPENTVAAFRAAVDLGADAVELDITRCASGEIVVIHDDTVDRTTNGSGRVDSLAWGALRELDAGSWFDTRFAGEPLPLLDAVLDAVGGHVRFNIEIKHQRTGMQPVEQELADNLRRRNLVPDTIVSSFDPGALRRLRRVAPEVPRALLYSPDMPFGLRHAWPRFWLRLQALNPHFSMVDALYVHRARLAEYRVNVWTVNEAADIERMAGLRVDAIITDHVVLTRRLMGHQGD
ncbi:MAG: glycerophosphodiester phosphodiesterase [Anaerolineae bacterium]